MTGRDLSPAVQLGWRRFWDGWIICPACKDKYLDLIEKTAWDVPPDYDRPIKAGDKCMKCRAVVPEPHP